VYFGDLIADAVANRLQAIATPLVMNMDKVQIIPPPKGVDPRVLVWKGAAVLGKMDGVSDLWLTATEWVSLRSHSMYVSYIGAYASTQDLLGIRGLRERCFYL
jgi:actin-related protein 8